MTLVRTMCVLAAAMIAAPGSITAQASMPAPLRVVPAPETITQGAGTPFVLASTARIIASGTDAARIADWLAMLLRPATGYALPVSTSATSASGSIVLRLIDTRPELGDEGYELVATSDSVRIVAARPAGLFHGVQTLRQLLPNDVESEFRLRSVTWSVAPLTIVDRPRFAWRGAMLDVARHFFTVKEVEQYIDMLALYKLNTLHLHLADDQGWRIEIKSRPKLATVGGSTQAGGGRGGYYTQKEFAEIVRYAQTRYVTIVPEIDLPGHSNALLASYPKLSCGKHPPALYSGTDVGWSTVCVKKDGTYALIDDVFRELAKLTPGRWLHIGGDEVEGLTSEQYAQFVQRVQRIVARHGKRPVGWQEIANARLDSTTLVQQWRGDSVLPGVRRGARVILSPAPKTYVDMKYTPATELGLKWAGYVEVRDAYEWDPAQYLAGVGESQIAGVEGPLWSETLSNIGAAFYMAMPRIPALAEVGWTPQGTRDWESFRTRIALHAPRWRYLGINYYPSPQIPW